MHTYQPQYAVSGKNPSSIFETLQRVCIIIIMTYLPYTGPQQMLMKIIIDAGKNGMHTLIVNALKMLQRFLYAKIIICSRTPIGYGLCC